MGSDRDAQLAQVKDYYVAEVVADRSTGGLEYRPAYGLSDLGLGG